jgi:hypothetical protein
MLVTPEDEMVVTILTDTVAVAMEQRSAQHHTLVVERFFMVTLLLKRSKYFAGISILLVTETVLAAIPYSYE